MQVTGEQPDAPYGRSMNAIGQGSSLLYGAPMARSAPARDAGPRGPYGAEGRLVALRPHRESGVWSFGWIGESVSLAVLPPASDRAGGGGLGYVWKTHVRPGGEKLPLTEDWVIHHRHIAWGEVPFSIRSLVEQINTETPSLGDLRSSKPPLHPNF